MFKPTNGNELKVKKDYNIDCKKFVEKEKHTIYTAIECDCLGLEQFPKPGDAPINIFSIVEPTKRFCFVNILRNDNNPLIKEFEDNITKFYRYLNSLRYFNDFVFFIDFVDTEEDMIREYWMLQRAISPDLSLSWGGFDMEYPTLIKRMEKLNIDKSIACDDEFKRTVLEMVEDETHEPIDHYDRRRFLSCMAKTEYRDQLADYINSHRDCQPPKSFMLCDVMKHETDFNYEMNKIDIEDIRLLPYKYFKEFVFGIIEASIAQYVLDTKLKSEKVTIKEI